MLLLPLSLVAHLAYSAFRERSPIVKLIEEYRGEDAKIRLQRIPILKNEFETTLDPRKKMINAIAIGAYYFDVGQYMTSLQYYRIAEKLAGEEDLLKVHIDLNLAKISLALKQPEYSRSKSINVLGNARNIIQKREAFDLLVASLSMLGSHKEIVSVFVTHQPSLERSKISHESLKLVANAYLRLGRVNEEISILESLAEQYPLTLESIWAFRRLVDYNCLEDNKRDYYFSERILQKLSVNRNLELGVEEFLISQSYLPVRNSNDAVRVLQPLERINFLLELNLVKAAALEEKFIEDSLSSSDEQERRSAIRLLARLNFESRNYPEAAKYFNLFLSQELTKPERVKATESLASSQFAMGAFASASLLYQRLVEVENIQSYSWEHFWSLFRAGNYSQALELLDRKDYIRLKDPHEPLALTYWRAQILDRLGRTEEANSEFRYILQRDATSYYANLALSSRPSLWKEFIPDQQAKTIDERMIKMASMDFAGYQRANSTAGEVNLLQDLVAAGLYQDAMQYLEKVDTRSLKDDGDKTTIQSLAYHLADYRSYRRIALQSFAEFQNFPKSLDALITHFRDHNLSWRSVFPLAYDRILTRVEENLQVDKLLILSLMRTESRYDLNAKSHVGARGLLQIMPKTALKISSLVNNQEFKVPELFDPGVNIGYGSFYLNRLIDYYQQNIFLAVASYNAGPITTNRWVESCRNCRTDELIESITYRETRRYVKEVIKYYGIYAKIYRTDHPFIVVPLLPKELDRSVELF